MIRRFELTDKPFALIEDLLPVRGKRGGRWNDHRSTLNGIFWRLYTGAQWREGPERYGKAKSIYCGFAHKLSVSPVEMSERPPSVSLRVKSLSEQVMLCLRR